MGSVESTVNYAISKRFVKKQQMQWTLEGASLLLPIRIWVLNGDLDAAFLVGLRGSNRQPQNYRIMMLSRIISQTLSPLYLTVSF